MRLMRGADISGDKIAFQYAADLWIMDRKDGQARRLTTVPGSEGSVRFSPDGSKIAFTGNYDGNADVYVMDADGGDPVRLTYTGEPEIVLDWTPDGKSIAYKTPYGSKSNRITRIFTISANGGMPTRHPLEDVSDASFSPDGTKLAYNRTAAHNFNWRRYRGGTQGRISFYDFANNKYSEIPTKLENRWQPLWVGDTVYYIGDKDFGTRNLFSFNVNSKKETRLTDFKDADIKNPTGDGTTMIWERNGYLETFDIKTKTVEKVKANIASDFPLARPRYVNVGGFVNDFALGPTGARLATIGRGDVFSVPVRQGDTRNMTSSSGTRERSADWSPNGKLITYLSDASGETQLWSQPSLGGKATMHRVSPRINGYTFSPDSKTISYTTGDGKLVLHDVATGVETTVDKQDWQSGFSYDWAPDGTWIVYTKVGDNLQNAVYLYNVIEKKSTKITEGYYEDSQVTFDQSGKFIYIMSNRTFSPTGGAYEFMMNMAPGNRVYFVPLNKDTVNPLLPGNDEEPFEEDKPATPPPASAAPAAAQGSEAKPADAKPADAKPAGPKAMAIDLDGIASRITPLPWPAGSVDGILGVSNGVAAFTPGGIVIFSMQAKAPLPVYEGPIGGASVNAKRNRIAINNGQGIITFPLAPGGGQQPAPVRTTGMEMTWDPKAEWKQMFGEVWRYQRDTFYDPKMLGLDWNAIGKQYEAMLPYVKHRNDLNYVFSLMIGELGTGHAYVSGGDPGESARVSLPVGHLGVDYATEGKFVKFAKIYPGNQFEEGRRGPLGDLGLNVKNGDYLLEIDGMKVSSDVDPHSLLQGKIGRMVTLTVNSAPTTSGSRKIKVRPIPSESELRYISWVEGNRAAVNKATNGRIGYIHVPDTSMSGVIEFIKGYYSQVDKDGWIIDERYNGGGMIPTFFVEFLRRQVEAKMKAREWKDIWFGTGTLDGPKVMMINEHAGSGGDMLPWLFKESKIGPLIGTRTWGGLVGIQGGVGLLDGGNVTSPGFGIYDHKKGQWIAENTGVDPDIEVDANPELIALGRDPQLEVAIKTVTDMAKKYKKQNNVPAFPKAK
jgi:tricorn protease